MLQNVIDDFLQCYGCCADLSNHNACCNIGNFDCFPEVKTRGDAKSHEADHRVAGAGDVEYLFLHGRNLYCFLSLLKEGHAVFAQCD